MGVVCSSWSGRERSHAQRSYHSKPSRLRIRRVHERGRRRLCHQDYEYDKIVWKTDSSEQSTIFGLV